MRAINPFLSRPVKAGFLQPREFQKLVMKTRHPAPSNTIFPRRWKEKGCIRPAAAPLGDEPAPLLPREPHLPWQYPGTPNSTPSLCISMKAPARPQFSFPYAKSQALTTPSKMCQHPAWTDLSISYKASVGGVLKNVIYEPLCFVTTQECVP